VVALDLFVVAMVVVSETRSLENHHAAARVSAQNLTALLEENLTAALDKIDLALLSVADEHARELGAGGVDPVTFRAFLTRARSRASALLTLRTTDAEGVLRHNVPDAPPDVNVADRDYFKDLRDHPDAGIYVAKPLIGRVIPRPFLILARRLSTPAGQFDGVAFGAIAADSMGGTFSALDVGPKGMIAVRWKDRSLVTRVGPTEPDAQFGSTNVSPAMQALLDSGARVGNYEAESSVDGIRRTFSLRHLAKYPLFVVVGLAFDDYLASWRREVLGAALLTGFFILLSALAGFIGYRALARRIESEELLRERAESLRESEERVAAEKERLAVTLGSIADGVIATDLEQRVAVINSVAERLCGVPARRALGQPVDQVFRVLDPRERTKLVSPVAKVLGAGESALSRRSLLLSASGGEAIVSDSAAPIRDRFGQVVGVVLVFRDITAQEKTEEELARVQKVESIAVLAGGIAHDFNNLLATITGNVSFARGELPVENEPALALADAEDAALRARGLTQQLLTFSKGGAPVKRLADVSTLLEETAGFIARGRGGACRFEIEPGLVAVIDEGQIGQVIQNLVLNGLQAMPPGKTLRVAGERIELAADNALGLSGGAYLRLTFEDQGVGIPAEVLPRIFDPFFTTRPNGKGLGLAICHSIVRKHQGHIEVKSVPGQGACFRVYLPAASGAAPSRRAPSDASSGRSGAGLRVLLMDDDRHVREVLARILRPLDYEIAGTSDGREAVALYREARAAGRPFAAVIMDLTVPGGMGGKETIQLLRELDPEVRAVVSSGYSNDPVMANFAEHGFRAVLSKPYVMQEVRETLRRVIDG